MHEHFLHVLEDFEVDIDYVGTFPTCARKLMICLVILNLSLLLFIQSLYSLSKLQLFSFIYLYYMQVYIHIHK